MDKVYADLPGLHGLEVDVVHTSGFAGEAAFVKVFDVAVIAVEEVKDIERDLPVFTSITEAGVDDEATLGIEGSAFFQGSGGEKTSAKGAEPSFVLTNRDAGGQGVLDGIGDGIKSGWGIDEAGIAPGVFGIEGEPFGWSPLDGGFDSPSLRGVASFARAGVADVDGLAITF